MTTIYYAAKVMMFTILVLGVDFGNVEVKVASIVVMILWLIQSMISYREETKKFYEDITK